MPGVLLCCLAHQTHREVPLAGVLLCRSVHQALKGAPWVGSYSVAQCVRCLTASLLFSYCCWRVGREAMVMAPPPTCDSAVSPGFHGCPAFFHRHFPPQSPPSHPLDPSLHSPQQPSPWDCSTIPKLQFPATAPSRGSASLSGVCMAGARTV